MLTHAFRKTTGIPPGMVTSYDTIHLIGAGGNGAPMLMRLHKIHTTLRAIGQRGLKVVVWDQDVVSQFNIGRQPFFPADIGKNKASVLLNRLKAIDPSIGDWEAREQMFCDDTQIQTALMVITCVDNKAARRSVHKAVFANERSLYWLDLGNESDSGQIVFGESKHLARKLRLPVVTEVFPEILDDTIPEDDAPSCSTEEAITKQGLFVNETVVANAAGLIWEALYKGTITHPIVFVNTGQFMTQSIGIDPAFYKRKGIKTGRRANPLIFEL